MGMYISVPFYNFSSLIFGSFNKYVYLCNRK